MLESLGSVTVRQIAEKARAARHARDRMVASLRETAFGEPQPARGAHDPAAGLSLDALPPGDPDRTAVEDALSALPEPARRELWALVLIGRGEFGVKDWEKAVAAANALADVGPGLFLEQADLHDYFMKALYEIEQR